jgi:hypothetical protein
MLLLRIERFMRSTRMPPARFGREAANDPNLVFDLRCGREPRRRTVQRIDAFMTRYQQMSNDTLL